ncbi:MAG: hypothetical protein AMR96_01610 [Candidatus Adiutrix intracellularis]|nr:MAG: hypothetical protein AMR96_01610 [Candidatus Adiutrix intracellularis]MDR2827412.1 serine/threonine-protein phosphatase [Candidatus Adiutrix intracellularis]
MFIDIHCTQVKKYGQNAFGDYFISKRLSREGRITAVLSDGLGSGVKANILACMTATMLLRFIEENFNIKKAAEIVMNSLPICKVRKMSYATFSILECNDDGNVRIIEEGNPDFIWMQGSEPKSIGYNIVRSRSFPNRHLKVYQFQVELGDRLIFCSDGVTQAGLGQEGRYKGKLKRSGLIELLQIVLKRQKNIASADLSRYLVQRAQNLEYNGQAKDDISAVVVYFRTPRRAMIFTGAPCDKSQDTYYAKIFERFDGQKAICGGTTAKLLARELGQTLSLRSDPKGDDLPPTAEMPGVDLITEGSLTLTRTLEYLDSGQMERLDAAGQLVAFLLKSDLLIFMVGSKLNQANYAPRQPADFEIRRNLVRHLADILEKKYLKKVNIRHF